MSAKPIMTVDVECPVCSAMLPVPVRLVDSTHPPTFEPDYSGAEAHVEAHGHMSVRGQWGVSP